jgi:hypothetical protein
MTIKTVSKVAATKSFIKVRLADGIVSRKATPVKNENGWWKASVVLKGEKVTVFRKSGRGIKTYELEGSLSARELKVARS